MPLSISLFQAFSSIKLYVITLGVKARLTITGLNRTQPIDSGNELDRLGQGSAYHAL
jgi:hypothetical protein